MKTIVRFVFSIGLAVLAQHGFAAPPQTINYQGYLTNPGGTPVNGTVAMAFRIYNVASGSMELYAEFQPAINVTNGTFNAVIGSVTPIPLLFEEPYWLTVAVNADAEMSPRQPLASSPYAFRAASLEATATIDGAQITGDINAPGNIALANSTPSIGNITKGGSRFMHNFGTVNTFVGQNAGNFSMNGAGNTAFGGLSLSSNTSGSANTAHGVSALSANLGGASNTATGSAALSGNTSGSNNTAQGAEALKVNTSGSGNIAIGYRAGVNLTTGSNNINIGNTGVAAEGNTIRIGTPGMQIRTFIAGILPLPVGPTAQLLVDVNGQVGTNSSSRRYKDDITDMNTASSALMNLRPVTFHYKTDQNPAGRTLQYGLIAEEVNDVYPGLVVYSATGEIDSVMYHHLPPMLLNEFQKQQRRINALELELQEIKLALRGR